MLLGSTLVSKLVRTCVVCVLGNWSCADVIRSDRTLWNKLESASVHYALPHFAPRTARINISAISTARSRLSTVVRSRDGYNFLPSPRRGGVARVGGVLMSRVGFALS